MREKGSRKRKSKGKRTKTKPEAPKGDPIPTGKKNKVTTEEPQE